MYQGPTKARLTRNQTLVMDALSNSTGPLSAYKILDKLRDNGFRAPLQVYRALNKLVEVGLVHKLESMNAFVACQHPGCEENESTAFTICEVCKQVTEITDGSLARQLRLVAEKTRFASSKSIVELRGICIGCQAA